MTITKSFMFHLLLIYLLFVFKLTLVVTFVLRFSMQFLTELENFGFDFINDLHQLFCFTEIISTIANSLMHPIARVAALTLLPCASLLFYVIPLKSLSFCIAFQRNWQ